MWCRCNREALETLLVLLRRRGEVVSKQELMERVWPDSFVEEGNLTQNIFLLRRELGKTPEGEEYIQTVPKRGYRMNVAVKESSRIGEIEISSVSSAGTGGCRSPASKSTTRFGQWDELAGCSLAGAGDAAGARAGNQGDCSLAYCVNAPKGFRVCADHTGRSDEARDCRVMWAARMRRCLRMGAECTSWKAHRTRR